MKQLSSLFFALAFSLSILAVAQEEKAPTSVHDFTVKSITGEDVDLSKYKGKILLIVNVASECGVTAQYETLQVLQEVLEDRNFVVMGFPANDFGGQEPGTNEEIAKFCKAEYAVTFPMFAKIAATGEKQEPLFKFLTTQKNPDKEGDIGWNFEKFLVGKDGKLLRRFDSNMEPDSEEMINAIKEALKTVETKETDK